MRWSVIGLICYREVRDQLRDRRTVFMLVVLPILLYPALGMGMVQFAVLFTEQPMKVGVTGREWLEADPDVKAGSDQRFHIDRLPRLIDGNYFAADFFKKKPADQKLIQLVFDEEKALAERMNRDELQAYIVFTEEMVRRLRRGEQATLNLQLKGADTDATPTAASADAPAPEKLSPKNERSELAHSRLKTIFREWEKGIVHARLTALKIPPAYDEPLKFPELKQTDRAERAWTRLFPFLLVMMALTGALYPAIDVCAGEKERGTMETLLISPVSRSEIVWGKFLTVWLFSAVTALMNLASMGITAMQFSSFAGSLLSNQDGALPTPGLAAFGWCIILMIPLAAFLSAMCLALAVYARSTKEGQYYLMPLMMLVLPLTLLSTAPGIELTPVYSMLPITGAALLLQSLMNARTADDVPWVYLAPVLVPLAAYCYLALRWAIVQFHREDVLFREAARLDLKLWVRHLFRDKEPLPSAAEAVACVIFIMFITWFSAGALARRDFVTLALVQQIIFTAMPPLMMALMLTTRPQWTLRLRWPSPMFVVIAVVLAIALHVPMIRLVTVISDQFPQIKEHLRVIAERLVDPKMSWWTQLLVIAALPAVCEEIAFRGFVLSGLSKSLGTRRAIIASSLLFALAHMDAFRFVPTLILGLVLGFLATRSGSILPGMIFHFVNNSMIFVVDYAAERMHEPGTTRPESITEYSFYQWPSVVVCTVIAVILITVLVRMQAKPHTGQPTEESVNV